MEIFPVPWGAKESRGIVQLCQLQLGKHAAWEIYMWTTTAKHVYAVLTEAF